MMNEERLKILVEYLKALTSLKGHYHEEIKRAILVIEQELGIKAKSAKNNFTGRTISKDLLEADEIIIKNN